MRPQTDVRDVLIIAAIVALVVLTLFLVTSYAQAQVAPTFRSEYTPLELHHVEHRHRRHHRHTRKVWRHHDQGHYGYDHDHGRCKSTLAIVGDQYASEQGAQQEADKAWMQTARWQHGERYMSRENAADARYECGRSSVGSVAGQIFIRCRLTARPCRPEPQGANK